MSRYIIIGTGVAGISAMETLRRLDPAAEIMAVTDDQHGFYSRPGLAYYLTNEIPKNRLTLYTKQDWKSLNVPVGLGRVTQIDPKNHTIQMEKGGAIAYDRLLLATGSRAVPLEVPGAGARGVVKLDTFEDASFILALARRARSAVVVGGGIIALEMVEGLATRGVRVHYFMRGERYWSNVLDEAESHIIEERLTQEGVIIHSNTEIAEVISRRGKVKAVRTKQGETIPCGIVGVGIGVKPRVELAKSAGLKTDRGILVNEFLQTSDPDIYAAGDTAQAFDPQTGTSIVDTLWLPARKQGWAAAQNMAGKKQVYPRAAAVNVLRLAGTMLTIIGAVGSGQDADLVGVARGSSETWLQLPNTIAMATGNQLDHLRVMVGERTLLGAVLMGDQKLSQPLQELVTTKMDITPIRNDLLHADAQLGHILMDYWSSTPRSQH